MTVFILYSGDEWLSRDSLRIKGVYAGERSLYAAILAGILDGDFTWRGLEYNEGADELSGDIALGRASFAFLGYGLVEEHNVSDW
jgi:hypothetical protein